MFSKKEFARASFVQMRTKDALCMGISNLYPECYERPLYTCPNILTDIFTINGEKYRHIFPKVGDIVVGISTDKYTITNASSICEIIETAYSRIRYLYDDDVKVRVLNRGYCRDEYWVSSLFFRYATEEERRCVR